MHQGIRYCLFQLFAELPVCFLGLEIDIGLFGITLGLFGLDLVGKLSLLVVLAD